MRDITVTENITIILFSLVGLLTVEIELTWREISPILDDIFYIITKIFLRENNTVTDWTRTRRKSNVNESLGMFTLH